MKKECAFIILLILGLISFLFDKEVSLFLANNRIWFLNVFFGYFDYVISSLLVLVLISLIFLKDKKVLVLNWISFLVSGLSCIIIKSLAGRVRPFSELSLELIKNVHYSFSAWNSSFLSWHSAAAFVAVPFLFSTKNKFKYIWIGFAIVVSLSRVYIGVHYLSDVIFGGLLGLVISYGVMYLENRYKLSKYFFIGGKLKKKV